MRWPKGPPPTLCRWRRDWKAVCNEMAIRPSTDPVSVEARLEGYAQ